MRQALHLFFDSVQPFVPDSLRAGLRRYVARRVFPDDPYVQAQQWLWRNRGIVPRDARKTFRNLLEQKKSLRVLELGTKRSDPEVSTVHREWLPDSAEFTGIDFQQGADVDVVGDVHQLASVFGPKRFDAVISVSTFEHILMPWIAAHQIASSLDAGGLVFVQTHQTFPVHAVPYDYWRFTTQALELLFNRELGMRVVACNYEQRCQVVSECDPLAQHVEAYLCVLLCAVKVAETPAEWPTPAEIPNK